MGTSRRKVRPQASPFLVLGLLISTVCLVVSGPGCNSQDSDRVLSAQEFETAKLEKGGVRELVNKIEILQAITPSETAVDRLEQELARAVPLEKASGSDLLVYESNKAALLSLDLCEACTRTSFLRGGVTMHWSQDGLEDELILRQPDDTRVDAQAPVISFDLPGSQLTGVPPIRLRGPTFGGWVLTVERNLGSILAFKKVSGFRTVPSQLSGDAREEHPNFGAGNGLLMAVVLPDRELRERFGGTTRISRMFELDDGKILLFFSQFSSEKAVHLLDLEEVVRTVNFDLAGNDPRQVALPRGRLPSVSEPAFLTHRTIRDVATRRSSTVLDGFQPLYLPPSQSDFCETGVLPSGGSALVYDSVSASFLRFWESPNTFPGESRGRVQVAISSSALGSILNAPPPYDMTEGILGAACNSAFIFERESSIIFDFTFRDVGAPAEGSLKVTAGSGDFLLRRSPDISSNGSIIPGGEETVLRAASNSLRGSHLYFDQGRDELLAVHFDTGNVVIVIDREDYEEITGQQLANFTWIEKLPEFSPKGSTGGGEVLRVFDTFSTALLEVRVAYGVLPVVDSQK